jgi:Transcriptional regulators
MGEIDINEVAESLSALLPTLDRKLIRPLEHGSRQFLSPLSLHAMSILSERDTITMTELAGEMRIAKPQLTPIIDKLIECNWASRENDIDDRRIIKIKITPAGKSSIEEFHKDITNRIKTKIGCLDKDDLSSLYNALNDLYRLINKIK